MIACYCRVSSARQKTDSQEPEIWRWRPGSGIDPSTVEWFEDKETGQTLGRPAFDRLRKAIFAAAVQRVVVWKLNRLSRRHCDGVNRLTEWCERGVRVVAVTQQIDLSGAVGRMVASVLFGMAEIDSEYRRERQAAGIAVAKARGVYRGRQPPFPSTRSRLSATASSRPFNTSPGADSGGRPLSVKALRTAAR
jgi:DNA invertase Pin-like site-specific DNA recombinase